MKSQIKSNLNISTKSKNLVVALKQQKRLSSQKSELNKKTNKLIDRLQEKGSLTGDFGNIVCVSLPEGLGIDNLLLVGLGESKKINTESYRVLCSKLAKKLHELNIEKTDIDFSASVPALSAEIMARHLLEAIGDQEYAYQKTGKASLPARKDKYNITLLNADKKQQQGAKKGAAVAHAISNGKNLARDLGNMPGNLCTPTFLASQARKLGRSHALKVSVLSEKNMRELGMGSLLSVSKGSREEAKLIVMQYQGAKNPKQAPHALVGKGLTFDAGGISIKPSAKMDEMKYDMCGAASVFGSLLAAAELQLPINIVGVIPSSENLPDGLANKPGDVVTSMSGKTIEILNTDAEGRLILCDALTYTERFKPETVIDIATLTGAVIVALGHQTAGVMGNDQGVIDSLISAGETSLDHAWQLPIKETYKKQLKSDYADLANIGGPTAGTITAACFLSYFAEKFRWAHLDIAGTAWGGSAGKRASGRAVPILTQYLIDQSN